MVIEHSTSMCCILYTSYADEWCKGWNECMNTRKNGERLLLLLPILLLYGEVQLCWCQSASAHKWMPILLLQCNHSLNNWPRGAMEARWTSNPKCACSNHVVVEPDFFSWHHAMISILRLSPLCIIKMCQKKLKWLNPHCC